MIDIEVAYPRHQARYANDPEFRARKLAISRAWYLKNKERSNARSAEWSRAHQKQTREAQFRSTLMRKYGLTIAAYERMLGEQNGLCAICHRCGDGERLCVDHEHVDGYSAMPPAEKARLVRGLLCRKCNSGVGMLRDNRELLARATEYLGPSW